MPIPKENRHRYPANWKEISRQIRFERAGNLCEMCGAENYQPHPATGSRVILTVAHLDHTPENNDPDNLKALCQRCHNRYDAQNRAERRKLKNQCTNINQLNFKKMEESKFNRVTRKEHAEQGFYLLRTTPCRNGNQYYIAYATKEGGWARLNKTNYVDRKSASTEIDRLVASDKKYIRDEPAI